MRHVRGPGSSVRATESMRGRRHRGQPDCCFPLNEVAMPRVARPLTRCGEAVEYEHIVRRGLRSTRAWPRGLREAADLAGGPGVPVTAAMGMRAPWLSTSARELITAVLALWSVARERAFTGVPRRR